MGRSSVFARLGGRIAALAVFAIIGTILPAAAQTTPPGKQPPPVSDRPRVEINPRPLLYRRCTDSYVIQNRPSGRVLFPERHCWWVRG